MTTKEITGRKLRVGDTVRRALAPPLMPGRLRQLGDMTGRVVAFFPNGGSGGGKHPSGAARVRWSSGSLATHDAIMLVKVSE